MKRLIRFLELWLDASCGHCTLAMKQLKEFEAGGENMPDVQFTLNVSKKPGSDGKIHEFHLLSPKK